MAWRLELEIFPSRLPSEHPYACGSFGVFRLWKLWCVRIMEALVCLVCGSFGVFRLWKLLCVWIVEVLVCLDCGSFGVFRLWKLWCV